MPVNFDRMKELAGVNEAEGKDGTVAMWLLFLSGWLTQYDELQRNKLLSGRRGAYHNPYALPQYLKTKQDIEIKLRKYLDRSDEEAIIALRDAIQDSFGPFPPIRKLEKALASFLDTGKVPSYKMQESILNEDLVLTDADKNVILAFREGESGNSKKLATDGKTLDGNWNGGDNLAFKTPDGKISWGDTGGKSQDVIVRYLKKITPESDLLESLNEATLLRDVKLKSGEQFTKGIQVSKVTFPEEAHGTIARIETLDGRTISMRTERLGETVSGFSKPPSIKTMEKWMNDGVAKSVGGKRVEPDGWDDKGTPSWLLALGLI